VNLTINEGTKEPVTVRGNDEHGVDIGGERIVDALAPIRDTLDELTAFDAESCSPLASCRHDERCG
jgi:hypothetical protein